MADAQHGQFVWYENLTASPKAAEAFYSQAIGWKTQPFAAGGDDGYTMFVGGQGPLAGATELPAHAIQMGAPSHWIGNVQVDDVDATAAQAKELGGVVYKAPEDIPTVGRYAVIADPQGAAIAIFKPSRAMALHDGCTPGEFCWRELLTSDSAAAFKFYSQLFGWKSMQDMDMGPMGTYRIYGLGDERIGGMMTKPPGAPMPSMWLYYIDVPDLEAAVARAAKLGAKLMNGPMDVPGGARIAQFMDPQGAAFALHQRPK